MSNELTAPESAELKRLEAVVERGLEAFFEVGSALLVIKHDKLYREHYGTFEAYCKERWKITPQHARRLMVANEIAADLKLEPTGSIFPDSERQLRPLASVPQPDRRKVWRRAVKAAPDGRPTVRMVQAAVDESRKLPATIGYVYVVREPARVRLKLAQKAFDQAFWPFVKLAQTVRKQGGLEEQSATWSPARRNAFLREFDHCIKACNALRDALAQQGRNQDDAAAG